jgi:hypothetical protein
MAHYNYIHHRIRRKRAKIDRKRVHIQRRGGKSFVRRRHDDECLFCREPVPETAEEKNIRLASVTRKDRLIPTSWRLWKGNINA